MAMAPTPQPKTLLGHHRVLSPSASIKVSPLCLGTMNFGEIWNGLMGECTKETAFAILDRFYGAGGNFIDTANMYMNGESEQWLDEWMAARGVRDDLVIATKYSTSWKMPFMEPEGQILSNYGGNNKKSLRLSLEASLKRLGTSYVDILYVHAWEGTTTIPELMRALDDVVRAGLVLYIGVSNWPAWVVSKANEYARAHGLSTFVVYMGRWNAAERDIERDVLPMCKAESMGITVWSALGGGKFKSADERKETGGRADYGSQLGEASKDIFQKAYVALEKIAKQKNANPTSIALRYVMLKAPYVFPVCGGRKIHHLDSNIQALSIDLTDEEINEIDSAVPLEYGYPYNVLTSGKNRPVTAADPAFMVYACGTFEGVEEPKVSN
ncbi:norsolorinic acid reductase [Lipomyces tetrasporus]